MSGRWLLDAAALFGASRRVVLKHVALRSHQFDNFNKTSSLGKAFKSQTDRVTLTVRAATAIAERFNEAGPQYLSPSHVRQTSTATEPVPSKVDLDGDQVASSRPEGLQQDHHYKRSDGTETQQPVPDSSLHIHQERAEENPLPDGTIPSRNSRCVSPIREHKVAPEVQQDELNNDNASRSQGGRKALPATEARVSQRQSEAQIPSQVAEPPSMKSSEADAGRSQKPELGVDQEKDVYYTPSTRSSPVLSSLPRVKVPKVTENIQESDEHVQDAEMNQDVYYSSQARRTGALVPESQAVPEQESVPQGMYSEIFQSPRVAKLLRGGPKGARNPYAMDLKGPSSASNMDHKAAEEKDTDAFSSRTNMEESAQSAYQKPASTPKTSARESEVDVSQLAADRAQEVQTGQGAEGEAQKDVAAPSEKPMYQMQESRVPSSRFGRFWQYGGLATSMAFGAVGEGFRRATGTSRGEDGSLMLSERNMERLVAKLSRMRGAALKLGQMMSFQDSKLLPAPIHEVLQRVQDSADYMPASQRNDVLRSNLGADWQDLFSSFEEKPMAAASIGQVHGAVLKSTGQRVAVKVQYPGVANSIDSDLNNLSILLNASRLLPKGLYLDKTIANARVELAWECDYLREAEAAKRFQDLLKDEKDVFVVPKIFDEASGPQVLTMERMEGVGVTKVQKFTQDDRDGVGTQILRLCLREITEFKYMQTDPNWTNFLYNASTKKLELLDFGASRDFPDKFIDPYIRILLAASRNDRKQCRDFSIQLGYLTGHESQAMLKAHIDSILTLAEPFRDSSPEVYDFRDQTITDRVKSLIPVMVRERLAPPPEETYSLHRKLSGAFLLCARLGSRVKCREMFARAMEKAGFA
ncbi:hypothetical protein MMC30_005520 [Trapelia coarctata]|nr:hypothetical protein [Trapelia coarctata]